MKVTIFGYVVVFEVPLPQLLVFSEAVFESLHYIRLVVELVVS